MPTVRKISFTNSTKVNQSETYTFSKQRGEKHTFTAELSFSMSDSVTVEAGLPDIAKVNDTFTWTIGTILTTTTEIDTVTTTTEQIPVIVPPESRLVGTFCWRMGTISGLPFKAI